MNFENFENFISFLKPYCWRLLFTVLGFAAAISFFVIGFWRTVMILLCCGIGYSIGMVHDKNIDLLELLRYWSDRRR